MAYTAEAFQNEFLALGATEVNAIVTVASTGADGGRRTSGATEIIIVDASGSMQAEGRMVAARPPWVSCLAPASCRVSRK